MRLVSFLRDGRPSFGCVEGDRILDFGPQHDPTTTLRDILPDGLPAWRALADGVAAADRVSLADHVLLAPVPNARKYLALGGNYASHAEEVFRRFGVRHPPGQVWFNKQVSSIVSPFADVEKPWISDQVDYEGELGIVIAHDCRHVGADGAAAVIAGYVVCNDLSVRDWQQRSPTHTLGKSFDTHGPFGPWIVTPDEIPDPYALRLRTFVNGELRQDALIGEMDVRVPAMIEELTTAFTLQAGDVLATGTPAGVGGLSDPPRFLRAGDLVRVEIDGIGHIENRVVDETARP